MEKKFVLERVAGAPVTTEELVADLQRVARKAGTNVVSQRLYTEEGAFSRSTVERRFGTWSEALAAAGLLAANAEEIAAPDARRPASERRGSRDPSLRLRFRVLKRDNFTCRACGASPANVPGLRLHVDHVKPWSVGGETVEDNLQTLCEHCNLGKSDVL